MKLEPLAVVLILLAAPLRAETPTALEQLGAVGGESVAVIQKGEKELKESIETKELFALKEVKNTKLLEIRGNQFGKLYIFAATQDKGTGERGVTSATMVDTFLFYFRFVEGTKVQMIVKDMDHRAAPGTPESKAIAESYPDRVLATVPFVSSDSVTGNVTIDARRLFMQDLLNMAARLQQAYQKPMKFMDPDSYLEKIVAFPKNLEVQVVLNYMGIDPPGMPDGNARPITMHYSVMARPNGEGFEPRRADGRVGFFESSYQDLTDKGLKDKYEPTIHLIRRWNLQKADPAAPVSDVKNPIVWWLDETIPNEYRPYVRAGLLAWNEAFEAVGLRNAVVVKEVDKDMPQDERKSFDPANASYNVVRWFMGDRSGMGVGPSRVDPETGEVFNVSIRLGDQLTRLTSVLTAIATGGPSADEDESLKAAASDLALAEAQGPLSPAEKTKFLGQLLTQLTAHEAGHTIGQLRHNFVAGQLHPLDEVGTDGYVSSSLMNYVPPNIGADGRPRGVYYQTKVGPYDKWAVEYAYKPLSGDEAAKRAELKAIADRAESDPALKYCTDEDAIGSGGKDPACQRFVLGRDVVGFARQRAGLADKALASLEASKNDPNIDPARRRETFGAVFSVEYGAAATVLPAIGGVRMSRTGGKTFQAVPAAEQRAALKYLDEKVFTAEPIKASPELLQSIGVDQLDRQYEPTGPVPLAGLVLSMQRTALDHIYNPATLSRLSDSSLYARQAVTPSEVLVTVRRSIWKEIEGGKAASIPLTRRNLQDEHVAHLGQVLAATSASLADARAAARRDLAAIEANARRAARQRSIDEPTRLHLLEAATAAKRALGGKGFEIEGVSQRQHDEPQIKNRG